MQFFLYYFHRKSVAFDATAAASAAAAAAAAAASSAVATAAAVAAMNAPMSIPGLGCPSSPDHSVHSGSFSGRPSFASSGGGGGSMKKTITAPGASFRGLLSLFDTATRSPRLDDSTPGGFFTSTGSGFNSGAGGTFGSGGGGSAAAVRDWMGGVTGRRKKGGGPGKTRRRGGDGDDNSSPLGIGASWHGVRAARKRNPGGFASGGGGGGGATGLGVGGALDIGSPLRRNSLLEPAIPSSGFGLSGASGVSVEDAGCAGVGPISGPAECAGDFVGGGHALCRCRSR